MSSLIALRMWAENHPANGLAVLVVMTSLAAIMELRRQSARRRSLRGLAAQWQMTYSPHDRLRIAAHVADALPSPGAADLYVCDVIWGRQGESYRYLFTLEYTSGLLTAQRRHRQVGGFTESRGASVGSPVSLELAQSQGMMLDQYRSLYSKERAD
jgi:hypothetical protein